MVDARLRSLKSGDRAYRKILLEFHYHCVEHRFCLVSPEDVDRAAAHFCLGVRRSKCEMLLSALLRAYPPLKHRLPWTAALVSDAGLVQPAVRHTPLPWGVALLFAHRLRAKGKYRRAVALLLQWRTGIRPGELLQLRAEDVQYRPGAVCIIALGMRRGTKLRRRAAIRILPDDWRTMVLIRIIAWTFAPGAPLADWRTVSDISVSMKTCARELAMDPRWTSHCPRAGWATAQFILGTPFLEVMEMGRWSSPSSLRIYLDVVASSSIAVATDVAPWAAYMSWLDYHFAAHWDIRGQ